MKNRGGENEAEANIRIDGSKDSTQGSWTKNLIIVILLVTSASFSFGYGISAFSTKPTNDTGEKPETIEEIFKAARSEIIEKLPQIIFFVGNMVASASTGIWYKFRWINRRSIFLVNNIVLFTSVFFALIAIKWEGSIYISRFLHGYQGGMACAIVPTFLTEIAPQRIRGKVGFLHQLQITIGIFFAQFFGLPQMFKSLKYGWTLTYLVGAIPSIVSMVFYKMLPMSPVELLTRFKNKDSAEVVLRKLRKEIDVSADIQLIEREQQAKQSTSNQMGIIEVIKSRDDRWQLIMAVALLSVQALSGINVVFAYADTIFKQMSTTLMPYLILITGLINVIATIPGVAVIEKVGRRSLLLFSNLVIIICQLVLTIIFVTAESRKDFSNGYTNVELAFAMIFMLIFIVAFALALGPIPFLYSTEITRSENRNAIISIALGFNYLFNILIVVYYIFFKYLIGGYAYLTFAIPVFFGTILFYFKMIETKNKNIEEIDAFFNAKRRAKLQEPKRLDTLA